MCNLQKFMLLKVIRGPGIVFEFYGTDRVTTVFVRSVLMPLLFIPMIDEEMPSH